MGSEVHVSSIAALREFAVRYKCFAQDVLEILEKAERDFQHRWEILEERYRLQQRRVAELRRLVEKADKESRPYYEKLLAEAEEALQEMRRQMGRVREQYEAYRHHAQRIRELANQLTPKAVAFLEGRASELEAYVAIQIPGAEASAVTPFIPSSASLPETTAPTCPASAPCDLTQYALPPGFKWVPLDEIVTDDVPGDAEFHKVNREEMLAGMAKLPQVLELLRDRLDRADNSIYLWRLDRQAGRSYSEGLQRVYDAFFGSEPVRLERRAEDGRWTIINGRHRVKLAKELGWSAVPASVSDTMPVFKPCPTCGGKGWIYPSHPLRGEIPGTHVEQFERYRNPDTAWPCPKCMGTGKVKEAP